MLHASADYMPIQDPRGIIPIDEPVFLLRATNAFAPEVMAFYAGLIRQRMNDSVQVEIVERHAERMAARQVTHGKKYPDIPPGLTFDDNETHVLLAQEYSDVLPANYYNAAGDPEEPTDEELRQEAIGAGMEALAAATVVPESYATTPEEIVRDEANRQATVRDYNPLDFAMGMRKTIEVADAAPVASEAMEVVAHPTTGDLPEPNVATPAAVMIHEPTPDAPAAPEAPASETTEESSCPAEERHARGEDRDTEDGSSNESTPDADEERPAATE